MKLTRASSWGSGPGTGTGTDCTRERARACLCVLLMHTQPNTIHVHTRTHTHFQSACIYLLGYLYLYTNIVRGKQGDERRRGGVRVWVVEGWRTRPNECVGKGEVQLVLRMCVCVYVFTRTTQLTVHNTQTPRNRRDIYN